MCSVGCGRQASFSWFPGQNGQIPYNAIPAAPGLFIGRAKTGADVTIGKVVSGHNTGHFPYGGKEDTIGNYEILCDTGLHMFGPEYSWIPCSNGQVPQNALVGGNGNVEPHYVGRALVNGNMCVGKVCQSHGCSFMPFGGVEHKVYQYEVLCYNR